MILVLVICLWGFQKGLYLHVSVSLTASGVARAIFNDALVSVLCDRMGGGEGEQSQHTAPHLPGTLPSWQCYPGR